MLPSNSHQLSKHSKDSGVHDVQALHPANPNYPSLTSRKPVLNGEPPPADPLMSNSKRLQDELEKIGNQIKLHEDNLKSLKSRTNQLDESILDLQVSLGKYLSSAPKTEDEVASGARSEEETLEQIMKHDKTAAGIFYQLKTRHGPQVGNIPLMQDFLGAVAMLGKVDDDMLSRLLSEYLGLETMLAMVCKSYDSVKALETYDVEGCVDKGSGIHGLGASIGRALEGRFLVISLESLRPYPGKFLVDDPQRKLDLPKPRLPSGDFAPGFLGFAVNMITIDTSNLYCLTNSGYGLRETLFYNLFSRVQVYRTRTEMLHALPCISDGAISLDGGMVKTTGIFSLGSREDMSVRFPKCSKKSHLPENYFEVEAQIKQNKWKKEKIQEDMRREQQLLEHAKYNFQIKKQEFVKFIADSSLYVTQLQMQNERTR